MADKKNKMGRPSKMTDEVVRKLEEAASVDASIEEMCFHADISKPTYYEWTKKNPHLLDRLNALRQRPVLRARLAMSKALDSNNLDAAKWYLERKRKAEFTPRSELTGADGNPLTINNIITNDGVPE